MCVVYLLSKGSHAKKDGGRLVIEKEGSVEASLPLLQVHHVVVGSGANISTPLLFFLIENHAEISFVDFHGKVLAGICGNRISWQRTKQQMDLFFDRQARLELIHTFLGEKLANQCKLLKYYAKIKKDQEVSFLADEIHFFQKKLLAESDEEVIRGLEGISSKKYFSAFPFLLNSHWEWNGRNRKPPRDPVNSLLSYGYAFLEREVRTAIAGNGLDERFGFFHSNNGKKDSLVYDFMELFRQPIIDKFVIKLLNLNIFAETDFVQEEEDAKGCHLSKKKQKLWISKYEEYMETENQYLNGCTPRKYIQNKTQEAAVAILSSNQKTETESEDRES